MGCGIWATSQRVMRGVKLGQRQIEDSSHGIGGRLANWKQFTRSRRRTWDSGNAGEADHGRPSLLRGHLPALGLPPGRKGARVSACVREKVEHNLNLKLKPKTLKPKPKPKRALSSASAGALRVESDSHSPAPPSRPSSPRGCPLYKNKAVNKNKTVNVSFWPWL